MEYYSGQTPQECITTAETYMVGRGASIKRGTYESVTFTRLVPPSYGEWVAMCILNVVVPGLGMVWAIARTVLIFMYPAEARIIAHPAEGRTRVLIDGGCGDLCSELEEWAKANLARKIATRYSDADRPDTRAGTNSLSRRPGER